MPAEPVVKLLSELVSIPSMNPMGRDRTGEYYCEKNIADFIAGYLKKSGVDTEVYEIAPSRPNVMGYVDTASSETLLLEAHMDTVHAEGMSVDPFTPAVKDGKLYGRGSCDTKGSIASILQAVISASRAGKKLRYNIVLLFVSDEEYRFEGAKAAVAKGLKASFGIAGEPTGLGIIRAHKGVTRWNIETRGKSAHSAYPERGKNAIYVMAEVIKRLETYAEVLRHRKPHELLGSPTLSVGVIEGGQAVNMVPDVCRIEIDRRSLPGETTSTITGAVTDVLKGIEPVEMEPPYLSVGGMEIAESSPVVAGLSEAVKRVNGGVKIEAAHYATDAGIYNAAGIPTVVFGPGHIEQAHTQEEFIPLAELEDAVAILQHLISE